MNCFVFCLRILLTWKVDMPNEEQKRGKGKSAFEKKSDIIVIINYQKFKLA